MRPNLNITIISTLENNLFRVRESKSGEKTYRYSLVNPQNKEVGFIEFAADPINNEILNVSSMEGESPEVGQALFEIAVKACINHNKKNIAIQTNAFSLLFHYQYGFRYLGTYFFPWKSFDKKFVKDPNTGVVAFLKWKHKNKFTGVYNDSLLQRDPVTNDEYSYDDILEFYSDFYNRNESSRKSVTSNFNKLQKINLTLPVETFAEKKKIIFSTLPLHMAIESGDNQKLEALLKDFTKNDPNLPGIINDHGKEISGVTPLQLALFKRNKEAVKLLAPHADLAKTDWQGLTPLERAMKDEDLEMVEILLQNKANPNARFADGSRPLYAAIDRGMDILFIRKLLNYGATPNIIDEGNGFGYSPLHLAVTLQRVPAIEAILEYKVHPDFPNDSGDTPLHLALKLDNSPQKRKMISLFLKHGADPFQKNKTGETAYSIAEKDKNMLSLVEKETLFHAATMGNNKLLVYFKNYKKLNLHTLKNEQEETLLHVAVKNNRVGFVEDLLKEKCNPNALSKEHTTPLLIAILNGNIEIIRLLLEAGAGNEPNTTPPLHLAARKKQLEIVKLLLEKGAEVNFLYYGYDYSGTALMNAVQFNDIDVVKLLLQNKADVNLKTESGLAPLYIAVINKNIDMTKMLLNHRANTQIKNIYNNCEMLLDYVAKDQAFYDWFIDHQAKISIIDTFQKECTQYLENLKASRLPKDSDEILLKTAETAFNSDDKKSDDKKLQQAYRNYYVISDALKELNTHEDPDVEISNFLNKLAAEKSKFKISGDPEARALLFKVLKITGTVFASIPTLGIVAASIAIHYHLKKGNRNYLWQTKTERLEHAAHKADQKIRLRH